MKYSDIYPESSFYFEVEINDEWEGYIQTKLSNHHLNIKLASISFNCDVMNNVNLNKLSYIVKLLIEFKDDAIEGSFPARLEHRANGLQKYVFSCDGLGEQKRDKFGLPRIEYHIVKYWKKNLGYISRIVDENLEELVVLKTSYSEKG